MTILGNTNCPSVAVVGGGLAGLATAAALCDKGFRVEVFEARHQLGGRAASFRDAESGELIDTGQHVSMGCCVNLADLCRRAGISDCFTRHRRLHFIAPDGRRTDFAPWSWLPAPIHLAPGILQFGVLNAGDRLRIAHAIVRLARWPDGAAPSQTIGQWLEQQEQSKSAIEWFWKPVLVSALGEVPERASLAAARKVLCDAFLASPRANEMYVPWVPLAEIFDRRLGTWLCNQGVLLHRSGGVRRVEGDSRRVWAVALTGGARREFDYVVVAAMWRQVRRLFSPETLGALPQLAGLDRIEAAPITAVHLWFDRPVLTLPHAVILGRLSQWVFAGCEGPGHCQVVISASRELKGQDRQEIAARIGSELAEIFPAAREATCRRWRVLMEPAAVFSVQPGLDELRPSQETPVKNLMLAGDWTATGWPATMEGAVRSGYLAAEAVLRAAGRPNSLLVPELPRGRLARWMLDRGPTGR